MNWTERPGRLAGFALLLLAAAVIINIALVLAASGDADPTKRDELSGLLRDINDNRALFFTGSAFSIAADALILPASAVLLFLLFSGRSSLLALFGLASVVMASVVFLAGDAANLATGVLASDFADKGGAGGLAAGDPAILQSARAMVLAGAMTEPIGSTVVAGGLFAFGALVAWTPAGEVNPPRWLGGLAMVAAAALLISWVGAANADIGLAIVTIGYAGALLWFVLLGGWLLSHGESQPEAEGSRRAGATT